MTDTIREDIGYAGRVATILLMENITFNNFMKIIIEKILHNASIRTPQSAEKAAFAEEAFNPWQD